MPFPPRTTQNNPARGGRPPQWPTLPAPEPRAPPRQAEGISELGTNSEHEGGSRPAAAAPRPPNPRHPTPLLRPHKPNKRRSNCAV